MSESREDIGGDRGICRQCGLSYAVCVCVEDNLDAEVVGDRLAFYTKQVIAQADHLRILGQWPETANEQEDHDHAVEALAGRLPQNPGEVSAGLDAGVACALDLIPRDKQELAARLHANYTPEAIAQVVADTADIENLDPESQSCWWLAACSLCTEGNMDQLGFLKQLKAFELLRHNPVVRKEAAMREFKKMTSLFHIETFTHPDTGKTMDIPFGTEDGCIQGAYLKGHPFAMSHLQRPKSDWYEVGSFHPSLGLDHVVWEGEYMRDGKQKVNGPQYGAKNFIRCGDLNQVLRALSQVKLL
jgi:hypothetical protein